MTAVRALPCARAAPASAHRRHGSATASRGARADPFLQQEGEAGGIRERQPAEVEDGRPVVEFPQAGARRSDSGEVELARTANPLTRSFDE